MSAPLKALRRSPIASAGRFLKAAVAQGEPLGPRPKPGRATSTAWSERSPRQLRRSFQSAR
eukprot:11108790-Lingulodinium_polyedra.AAC.1